MILWWWWRWRWRWRWRWWWRWRQWWWCWYIKQIITKQILNVWNGFYCLGGKFVRRYLVMTLNHLFRNRNDTWFNSQRRAQRSTGHSASESSKSLVKKPPAYYKTRGCITFITRRYIKMGLQKNKRSGSGPDPNACSRPVASFLRDNE
jgi:hypothetical protein